jgi:predicted MFS family arabinose efflux permease
VGAGDLGQGHSLEGERRRSGSLALIVLTGLNALNYADRYVGAAVLPLMLSGLSLSDAEGGILQSAFIVVYSLVSPAAGWLGDRRARLPIAAVGVLVWSGAVVASGLAPTYMLLLLARAVTGAGEAAYAVVAPSVLSDLFPPERRGRALAMFYAAMPVGAALGYAAGGAVGAQWGWRAAFFVAGVPGVLLALALMSLREPVRGAFDEMGRMPPTPLTLRASIRALGSRPSYVMNTVAQVLYTFALGGLATWMPTYFLRERHIPLAIATTIFGALLMLAGLGGTLLGGQLGDWATARRRGGHFTVSGWSLVASLAFTIFAVLSPMPTIFWPSMFGSLFLLFLNVGPLNAAMANVLPPDLRTRGFAVTTMAIHLFGDAASPWLIGLASDRVGLTAPVLAAGTLLAVSGVVLLAGRAALERDLRTASTPGPAIPDTTLPRAN